MLLLVLPVTVHPMFKPMNLTIFSKWCNKNDMIISVPKYSSVLIGTRQKLIHRSSDNPLSIKTGNELILYVPQTKLLGMHFDQTLS